MTRRAAGQSSSVTPSTHCLDAWLDDQGVAGLDARIPLLSYGSNACPEKFVRNGVSLPGVNLRVTVHDLAAVYCQGTRSADGAVPATLAARARPPRDPRRLLCSGSPTSPLLTGSRDAADGGTTWCCLPRAASSVTTARCSSLSSGTSAAVPSGIHCATGTATCSSYGTRPKRRPRQRWVPRPRPSLEPDALGPVWPLGAPVVDTVCSLFVYGTLMPGQPRWEMLAPFVQGEPEPALARGALVDTGRGYPAMFPGEAAVPGYLVQLKADSLTEALDVLDRVEGTATGLFRARPREYRRHAAWVYRAVDAGPSRHPHSVLDLAYYGRLTLMSHLALTASFGSATRYHSGPKHVRVFGQLLVGGSGVYLFQQSREPRVDDSAPRGRVRPGRRPHGRIRRRRTRLGLDGEAARLAETCRSGACDGGRHRARG